MQTRHHLKIGDARSLAHIPDASVHLIVTSPPYPMIALWDGVFAELSPEVGGLLAGARGMEAFEAMHRELDGVWAECARVLTEGGFLCVNVGDATRTVGGRFCLYPNHSRIMAAMLRLGLCPLPDILWRKPTNAPNKFMGSGMLPAGAYVTYEHEYVLILRRGGPRRFEAAGKIARRQSACFFAERNLWFSDLWTDLSGADQRLSALDAPPGLRSAAFPLELPWRLIHMYSIQGDTVLDPFAGTGTALAAALMAGRSSLGVERRDALAPVIARRLAGAAGPGQRRVAARLEAQRAWIARQPILPPHRAAHNDLPVFTRQETGVRLIAPLSVSAADGGWIAEHAPI